MKMLLLRCEICEVTITRALRNNGMDPRPGDIEGDCPQIVELGDGPRGVCNGPVAMVGYIEVTTS